MKCPQDQAVLLMSDKHGIEVDYCPDCRGVWLDRGELDKIIERAVGQPSTSPQQHQSISYQQRPAEYKEQHRGNDSRHDYDDGYHHKKKKESFLGDLFDF